MNAMRKLLRLAPLMALPLAKTTRLWMASEEPASPPSIPLLAEELTANIVPHQPIKQEPQNSQPAAQQPNQQENQKAEDSLQTEPSAQIKQTAEGLPSPVAVQQESVLPTPQEPAISIHLKENEAVVHSTCPAHIVAYLEKTNFLIHRTDDPAHRLRLKNARGDTLTLDAQPAAHKDEMQLLSAFINPPLELTTLDQAKQLLQLQKEGFLVCSYLPTQEDYDSLIASWTRSPFDNFTTSRKANLAELEHTFTSLAYNSASNLNAYFIARTREVADYLRINHFSIGVPYILNRTTRDSGNESNCEWEGIRYNSVNLAKQWRTPNNPEVINHLTHFYINRADSEAEAYNKIRQMQMSADPRKLLLIYTNEKRQEFHKQLDEVLEKVARTEKERVVVLKTQNVNVLRELFKVEPENFTTVRLFDLSQPQSPLFAPSHTAHAHLSRSKLKGPFKYENICNWISSSHWEEYYESKRQLTSIKTAAPEDLKKLDNTVVLLEKDGCSGCKYVEESLDELKKVTKALTSNSKFKKNLIYRYRIEDPNALASLKIRRYSVFNESPSFAPPTTTPKLFLFSEGKMLDLRVDESLERLKEAQNGSEGELVHDLVLADIIARIRRSQNQVFTEI